MGSFMGAHYCFILTLNFLPVLAYMSILFEFFDFKNSRMVNFEWLTSPIPAPSDCRPIVRITFGRC